MINKFLTWLAYRLVREVVLVDPRTGNVFKATLKQVHPVSLGNLLKGLPATPTVYTDHEWIEKRIALQRKRQNFVA